MNEAAARARLEQMVQKAAEPTLSDAEIDDLLALARRPDADGNVAVPAARRSTAYGVGDVAVPSPSNGHQYKVTAAGVTAADAPAWPTGSGAAVADGTVTWQEAGSYAWTPTFDLNFAAAEGWRQKAGKQVPVDDISVDGQSRRRSQIYEHCLRQAEEYASKVVASLPVERRWA